MGRRSGFTLVETLIAVIIVSLMTLMAYPRVNTAMTKSNLRGARTRLVNMLAAARAAATQNSRQSASVKFNGNTAVVTATPRRNLPVGANTEDTLGVLVNLSTVYGATLTVGNGMTAVSYDPRGIGTGFVKNGGTQIQVSRGGYTQSITLDMLGRVTK